MMHIKGLITLYVVSLAFWVFPRIFTGVLDTNMLASENVRKTRENVSISHYSLGKKISHNFGMFEITKTQTQSSKLRNYFMHPPGAQIDKTMHPAIFECAHFYIKVFIMLNIHAHAGFKTLAPGSQNVHTGCRVHP